MIAQKLKEHRSSPNNCWTKHGRAVPIGAMDDDWDAYSKAGGAPDPNYGNQRELYYNSDGTLKYENCEDFPDAPSCKDGSSKAFADKHPETQKPAATDSTTKKMNALVKENNQLKTRKADLEN